MSLSVCIPSSSSSSGPILEASYQVCDSVGFQPFDLVHVAGSKTNPVVNVYRKSISVVYVNEAIEEMLGRLRGAILLDPAVIKAQFNAEDLEFVGVDYQLAQHLREKLKATTKNPSSESSASRLVITITIGKEPLVIVITIKL